MYAVDSIQGIPCFGCVIRKNLLSPHRCMPEHCEKLGAWVQNEVNIMPPKKLLGVKSLRLIDESEVPKPPKRQCPHCNSESVVRSGFYRHKKVAKQLFRCNNCGRRFREGRHTHIRLQLIRFRTPIEIIRYAFMLNGLGVSTRGISAKIKERFGKKISHVTIADWLSNKRLKNACIP